MQRLPRQTQLPPGLRFQSSLRESIEVPFIRPVDFVADDGKTGQVSYRLVSGGTALEETLQPPDEPSMLTLYSADGARVALTHFCPMNNQPRMAR